MWTVLRSLITQLEALTQHLHENNQLLRELIAMQSGAPAVTPRSPRVIPPDYVKRTGKDVVILTPETRLAMAEEQLRFQQQSQRQRSGDVDAPLKSPE